MVPINNSDTAWLIVSDYNQENGKFYEDLRKDIIKVEVSQWYYEWNYSTWIGGGILGMGVGGHGMIGSSWPNAVGYNLNVGGDTGFNSRNVGGNYYGFDDIEPELEPHPHDAY